MKQPLLLSFAFLFLSFSTKAQPAQIFLGGSGKDQIAQIVKAPDGSLLATGAKSDGANMQVWLLKISQSGDVLWEKTFAPLVAGTDGYGYGLTLLPDGSIVITGEQRTGDVYPPGTAIAIKTDANGAQIWKRSYANVNALFDAAPNGDNLLLVGWEDYTGSGDGGLIMLVNANGILQWKLPVEVSSQTKVRRIFPTNDAKYVIVGRANVIGVGFGGIFLQKIEPDGTPIWQQTAYTNSQEQSVGSNADYFNQSLGAALQPDGSIWVANALGWNSDVTLLRFSADGDLLQQKNYGSSSLIENPYGLTALPDGGWLITGSAVGTTFASNYQGFAARIDANGLELWRQYYGTDGATDLLFGGVALDDGQFMLAGMSNNTTGNGDNDGWLLHAEPDGNILPWTIEGQIIVDLNNNCIADAGEPPAAGWFVAATDISTQLVVSDSQGNFSLRRGDGITMLTALAPEPSGAWTFCNASQFVISSDDYPLVQLTFLAQSTDGGCPHTEVSITQPDLMRCSTSNFIVTVQNRGAGASGDLLLNLVADPAFSIVSASEPFFQNGNSIDFEIDPMEGFQQKIIEIEAKLSCDVQIGATHAMAARLMPVECAPSWNGPRFAVEGLCPGDEVLFFLKNEGGGGVSAASRYRVMADDLLHLDWTNITLPEGAAAQPLTFPADGRTWRVELEQAQGFPAESHPAVAIEGCGTGGNGLHSIAMRNAWRYDDGVPEVAAVLAPNTTGVPNKIAEALHGFGFYNFVGDNDWLEFTARVRNDLGVAAEKAEFRLSFSPNLDISTFQALACNAPVQLELDNTGVVRAVMQNFQLDTGNYAMLRFRIRPYSNTPADSGTASLFLLDAEAYLNGQGPYSLEPGFHNYSKTFPVAVDEYNNYPPEILRFGGVNYDFGTAMAQAADGSVFLCGESNSFSDRSNFDGFIVKADATGRAYWQTAFDLGDRARNTIKGVAALPDGGCMVAGNYAPPETIDFYLSDHYAYTARVDANGKMLWHKKFRPAGMQYGAWTNGIVSTADGHFVFFGYSENENNGIDQFYIKIDANGEILWQQYEHIVGSAFTPIRANRTADGGFVFMGTNESTVVNFGVFLEKIDANGNKLWGKGYDSNYSITPGGLAQATDDGFLVAGYSQWEITPGNYGITPTFIRFSSQGDFLWEKNPAIGPFNISFVLNTIAAPGGGFLAIGEVLADTLDYFDNVLLLKIDENGDMLWWRGYGSKNTEWAEDAVVTLPNQILIWGFNQRRPPLWDLQAMLVRTDLNGDLFVGAGPEPATPAAHVTVFPNPAGSLSRVVISPAPNGNIQWQLNDLTGRVVRCGISEGANFDIEMEHLPAGVYFLTFPQQHIAPQRIAVGR